MNLRITLLGVFLIASTIQMSMLSSFSLVHYDHRWVLFHRKPIEILLQRPTKRSFQGKFSLGSCPLHATVCSCKCGTVLGKQNSFSSRMESYFFCQETQSTQVGCVQVQHSSIADFIFIYLCPRNPTSWIARKISILKTWIPTMTKNQCLKKIFTLLTSMPYWIRKSR
jgi:hypothetical protein